MRTLNPGELGNGDRAGTQDAELNYARVYIGQIKHVDPETGIASIIVPAVQSKFDAVIPVPGLSVHGFESSWLRFMPQAGDFVKVAYGPDNRPEIMGMATWGHDATLGYRLGGYAELVELGRAGIDGLTEFPNLRPGEFDLRSSGGAYIKGDRNGTLVLAGGALKLELSDVTDEFRMRGSLVTSGYDGCILRLGDVKRLQPGGFAPEAVAPNPTGAVATKEYAVVVGKDPSLELFRDVAGDVRSDLGTVILATSGQPARRRTVYYTAAGLEPGLITDVDSLGNASLTHGTTATTGLALSGTSTPLTVNYASVAINSGSAASLTATGNVLLGDVAATDPVVRGTELALALTRFGTKANLFATAAAALSAVLAKVPALTPADTTAISTFATAAADLAVEATTMASAMVPGDVLSTRVFVP